MTAFAAQFQKQPVRRLNIVDFACGDWTLSVRRALSELGDSPGEIFFPPGRYEFHGESAEEHLLHISNHHNPGARRVAVPLIGKRDTAIRGAGADNTRLVFHGRMIPILAQRCANLELSGFSIDFEHPFYGEAEVLDAGGDWCDLRPSAWCRVECGETVLIDGEPLWGAGEVDAVTGRLLSPLNLGLEWPPRFVMRERSGGVFRLHVKRSPRPGSRLVLRHGLRDTPAVYLDDSEEIFVCDVLLHHAPGMGLIAQACRNLLLRKTLVLPTSGRSFSLCADALHFVNCAGHIEISDCLFRNQFDDAINIHGIYVPVVSRTSASGVIAERRHENQKGAFFAREGDRIRVVDRNSMLPIGELCCRSLESVDPAFFRIGFDRAVPDGADLVLENLDWIPERVEIRNSRMRDNNPRGILVSSGKEVLIEGNDLSSPFCAVQIAGDADYWFESGPVQDVTIRGNEFHEVNYLEETSGCGIITVNPEIKTPCPGKFYHGTLTVENNVFRHCTGVPVAAKSLSHLIWKNNAIDHAGKVALSENCGKIDICGNPAADEVFGAALHENQMLNAD